MSDVLVIAEVRRGVVRDITFELVTAARGVADQAGGRVLVAVIDADPAAHADQVGAEGADELLLVPSPVEPFEPHVTQAAVEALVAAQRPAVVLVGQTIDGMAFAPAVAARAGMALATDVSAIRWDGAPVVTRGAYADKLELELDLGDGDGAVVTVRPGAFAAATRRAGVPAREVALELGGAARTEHVAFRDVPSEGVDITKAEFLLAIGRGVEDEASIARFEELAERMGATLSVSRPIVDAGWAPSARQVGQSGKTVRPKVYLALGISGAIQHLAGMRNADTIIAINTDSAAPIFGVAHYGAVADLFDVADELERHFG